jgi:hypothetical protein
VTILLVFCGGRVSCERNKKFDAKSMRNREKWNAQWCAFFKKKERKSCFFSFVISNGGSHFTPTPHLSTLAKER